MAIVRAKVIGPFEVGGVAPGRTTTLDDEVVNIPALLAARLISEPKKKKGGV